MNSNETNNLYLNWGENMSKAMLIMDMPTCCNECRFFNDNYDYPQCIITGETKGYKFKKFENKMDSCPLRFVPSKRYHSAYGSGQIEMSDDKVWNRCIDTILGQ